MEQIKPYNEEGVQHNTIALRLWHGVNDVVSKFGLFRTLYTSFVVIVMSMMAYIALNPSKLFEAMMSYQDKRHNESVHKRFEKAEDVNAQVRCLQADLHAARAIVLEFHNGKQNPAGLSFNYLALTYEALREGVSSVSEEYADFSADRFVVIQKLFNEGYWSGTLRQLQEIDPPAAHKIAIGGADYVAMTVLYGQRDVIGILAVVYMENDHINEVQTRKILRKYSSLISANLDFR